jgi:hypothetical protein
MPIYYFNIELEQGTIPDLEGTDVQDPETARKLAELDAANPRIRRLLPPNASGCALTVLDEQRAFLFRVPFLAT